MPKRRGSPAADQAAAGPVCHYCQIPAALTLKERKSAERTRRGHWYAWPEKGYLRDGNRIPGVADHVRDQLGEAFASEAVAFRQAERERRDYARILARYPEYEPGDELEPARAARRLNLRNWEIHAESCTSPEVLEALANECLSDSEDIEKLRVALDWISLWRRSTQDQAARISAQQLDSLVKSVPEAPSWWDR